jgi:hypothetical protein
MQGKYGMPFKDRHVEAHHYNSSVQPKIFSDIIKSDDADPD